MLAATKALAYEWTDENGVTWTFYKRSFTINGESQSLWYINGASGYGENVTVPQTVYNGETACMIEALGNDGYNYKYSSIFVNGSNVTLPSTIKYIEFEALNYNAGTVKINSSIPPTLGVHGVYGSYPNFGVGVTVLVPAAYLEAYRNADVWKDMSLRIISQSAKTNYDINVIAQASSSGIHQTIGEDNLINVMTLKVKGSINSYDILIMRNKMHNLHHLDLTEASIVTNSYEYYDKYHTTDNVLGDYAFCDMTKLITVELPNSVTTIGGCAFSNCAGLKTVTIGNSVQSIGGAAFNRCSGLTSVTIPNSVTTIGYDAFNECSGLTSVTIPNNVTSIGHYAFSYCRSLTSVTIPGSVQSIGQSAFNNCSGLTSVTIGNNVKSIEYGAFAGCSGLKEIHFPSSIRSIGSEAFSYCTSLKDYYSYTVEPISITESTFSNWSSATLHIPSLAYYNYYWDTQWSKFAFLVEDSTYKYGSFYLSQDLNINNSNIDSSPDVDLNAGSGLVVEATNNTVSFDDVHLASNTTSSASIIANGNLTVENLYFDITVTKNKWYFLTFPFRVKLTNVTSPGDFVFRYYDGAERATNGNGGWKNVETAYLNVGQGYIFQTNTDGTLTLKVEKADMDFSGNTKQEALSKYSAESTANASWNFLGNPHPCYFDISKTGYTAPITVWNGSAYQAVRANDDKYFMQPFQAFFVQKPEGTSSVNFPADGRYTYHQMLDQTASARAEAPTVGAGLVPALVACATGAGTRKGCPYSVGIFHVNAG